MNSPLVSIICVSYNHEKYILSALESVVNQCYKNIEIIVVDDASTDNSQQLILAFTQKHSYIKTILLSENQGNCAAFNLGFNASSGKYIVDFATDDLLHSDRITTQVIFFESLDERYGVIFSDSFLIDFAGNITKTFYKRNSSKKLIKTPWSGDIYKHIIKRSYICSPTMMIRRKVLEKLGGYDESLSYEDYDFWVRSSRSFLYAFQDKILTSKRVLKHSHGKSFYKKEGNTHLKSTLKIHKKAYLLNQNALENKALAHSVRYHMRLTFYTENFNLTSYFVNLLHQLNQYKFIDYLYLKAAKNKVRTFNLYNFYRKIYHHL